MSTPSKPGRNIDDARRRFAESRNRPMLQIPPTTSAMFGAPATTQAAPSGLFGAPASSTAAPTTGLFGSAPAAGGGLFGGSTTTQAPKPSTGLFGAPAASTAAPTTGLFGSAPVAGGGLFGGSTTTQAPASGLFGAAKPSGGLFGATTTAPTAPASGLFGAAQPQLAPAQQRGTIEDLIQNSSALVASVGDPQIYPDDRNQIVALLNQLQAVVGIGKGYYNSTSGPVEYTSNGPYFRLKGICYNRLSDHEDSDGMVSLILKVPATKVATSQVRQQIVDELYIVMGSKPNLQPRIDSVVSLPNDKTEVTFYVEERGKGRVECKLLAQYLGQDAQYKALQTKLELEQLIPRAGVSKQMLRHYLENAPEGFDPSVWAQASVENPDPEKLIPFPIRGFDELLDRQKRQKLEMNFQNNITADMEDHVKKSKKELTEMYAKMLSLRQKQKQFSYRLLRVLAMQTLIQRYGARLDESEVRLQYRLEQIMAHLNGPGDLKTRIENVQEVLRSELPRLMERQGQLNDPKRVFRGLDVDKFRDYLAEIQTALEQVYEVCSEHRSDLEVMEKKKNW